MFDEEPEKDSLFSSDDEKNAQRQTRLQDDTPEIDETIRIYPDDELEQLVSYFKNTTILYDLREEDWNDVVYGVIKEFITDLKHPVLTIYFNGDTLSASLGMPESDFFDMCYFLREPLEVYDPKTFYDNVIFGTMDHDVDGSILKIIENVYAPIFFKCKRWPESVKNNLVQHLQMFLAKLTDIHSKQLGLTGLYIPREAVGITIDEAMSDKELIKRLEAIVVYWTKQVRASLQEAEQNVSNELLCPLDEYKFWVSRFENLSGLKFQLDNQDLKYICEILVFVRSSYIHQFITLTEEIDRSLVEAKSNIEYLQVLMEPCSELCDVEVPRDIPPNLTKILHIVRFIWINSPFYNSVERITTICRYLSNQLLIQCSNYIDLDLIFDEKQTRKGVQMLNVCIDCLTQYIRIYVLVSESHTQFGVRPWKLDKSMIFNHVDSFIQRCKDLVEICEAMITFGRYDETADIPKPSLGTSRWQDFDQWSDLVESLFNKSLSQIKQETNIILDVHASQWYNVMLQFRNEMKDIEVVVENFTNSVFEEVGNVEEALESLGSFHNFFGRETLRPLFETKTIEVLNLFQDEIYDCKQDLTKENQFCVDLPFFSGRAHITNMKKNRLLTIRQMFKDALCWMIPLSLTKEILSQCDKLVSSIDDRITNLHKKWINTIGEDVESRLQRTLMCKSKTHPGQIECNIDRSLLSIARESKYWQYLNYEIPPHIEPVYKKYKTTRFIYESVLTVVMDYNKIISSLSDEERLLFRPLITAVEKKISPGLNTLTWSSEVGDEYIAECCTNTAELQEFLDDYKTCNLQIASICEKICNTLLFELHFDHPQNLDTLNDEIHCQLNNCVDQLVVAYQDIIEYILIIYKGFEYNMNSIANEWLKYVNSFDTLMEEALKICCRNTLQCMYEVLHGDDVISPQPVLQLVLTLTENKITFTPSLKKVSEIVADILPCMIDGLQALPRLNDKFHVANLEYKSYWQIIEEDNECQKLQHLLSEEVNVNTRLIDQYLLSWLPFRHLWEVEIDPYLYKYEAEKPTTAELDEKITHYIDTINKIQLLDTLAVVHFIQINCIELKKSILEYGIEWQRRFCNLLYNCTIKNIDNLYDYMKLNTELIQKEPKTLPEMQKIIALFDRLREEIPIQEKKFPVIDEQVKTIDKFSIELSNVNRNRATRVLAEWNKYLETMQDCEKMLGYVKDNFKMQLLEESKVLKEDCKAMLDDFLLEAPFSSKWNKKDAFKYITNFKSLLTQMRGKEKDLADNLALFGLTLPDNMDLNRLEKEIAVLELVWQLADEWDRTWDQYKSGKFWEIRSEEMEETTQTLFRKLTRLSRELKDKGWDIVDSTRDRVDAFRRTLPLIADLKNPAMRPRHWDRVRKAMNRHFDENSARFNLEAIYAMEMHKFGEEINDISNAATMELQIENGLKAIAVIWKTMTIELVAYKDGGIYRIKAVDECLQTLEENMTLLSTMKSTRFVEPFTKEVDYWERTLSYIMETLEIALMVQRQWLYLESIFYGDDIRKQLPNETDHFEKATYVWRAITQRMFYAKTAYSATHIKPAPYLLDRLNRINTDLERIQRALEVYLETKRQVFPRFYFISNDDLLEILGNSKKPEAVQVHLKKLFDNINKLKITKNIVNNKPEAVAMISDDGETIEFEKCIKLEGPVENWLIGVERQMRQTLKRDLKPCRVSLKKMLSKRDKWLLSNCGQLCITCSQMQWTTDCTRALVHAKITESKKPLKKLRKRQNMVLSKLSEMSRKDLTKIQRLKTNALITIEIHSRDVVDRLYKANCRDVNSFEWFAQLRFYWDRDTEECIIKQTNTSFSYGYEYSGNSGRLVITPLTDRCYITLTTALHLYRGGSPKGPAGTGKTETVKDLGKSLGMWVIVNNCSEGLDYKSMGKCFSGLAQTGAWGCFDEFNRINIEVLSVVAQQILSILSAISRRVSRFVFEGSEINLKLSVGIFITMNPGYAGRTELPDNLKSMFRPISMMVPDSSIIAENILFSDGFQNTKLLSKKVYVLYQLAQQQLSKQDHYDFGLRSMVALLRYGGRKRRQYPNLPEDQIIYLAMRDMNIARLTSDDLPLFNGIMSDIFPGISPPTVDYTDMNNAIVEFMLENNFQPIQAAINKVIQLYETKSSRHSVMIIGNTCTAKSTTWKVLQGAMGKLAKLKVGNYKPVQVFPINPKSLNLGELYGEYNLSTNEWLDGVISATMRLTCTEDPIEEKWILFDGPVDAVWIENMNSVMDDNKVLTLINSDRITMPEQVSLLFEVGDLAVASPATVSRCGMVYNDYKDWGWKPYVASWLQKQAYRGKLFLDTFNEYFDWYLPNVLEFKRLNCRDTVGSAELNLVMSLCKLLEILATIQNGVNPHRPELFDSMSKLWFLFCLIWSVCSTTDEDGRRKLDNYFREKETAFPIKDTIYEYYVDTDKLAFVLWENRLPYDWRYSSTCAFYEIIVPTVDTVRYEYIANALLSNGCPVLLTGPVGTGKTSTAKSVLDSFDRDKFIVLNVNMSAQTSSVNLQDTIESRLEKRTKGVYVPLASKNMITFLDDLNMPAKDVYGSQPPLELLRQWMCYGFWYDRQKQTRKYVMNMDILAAMGPPGGGRTVISGRLLSRFNVINMTLPDEANIIRIFGTMINQHLTSFDDTQKIVGREITIMTIDMYDNVTTRMLPTPTKIHYLFNLRDISKVFQGLLRMHKDYHFTKASFLRLWVHESFRVFYDRLIDDKDREWFFGQINEQLGRHFDVQLHNLACTKTDMPVFGDFINPWGIYEDLQDLSVLRKHLEQQMAEYNVSPGVVKMDLVLFQDAIEHICRIIRVISQPKGNMLLIGIGGSGRHSLARLAAYICEYNTYQITITKNYKMPEFKEDLKTLYNLAGVDGKQTNFLFDDTQITDEGFLEIINNMLSTSEVSNLYKVDEFEEVKNRLMPLASRQGVVTTAEGLYNFLISRVKKNLHIVLCMSPVGDDFRNRLRQYPGLINCSTIDWFCEWPQPALLEVAYRYISDINFVETITGQVLERRRGSVLVSSQDRLRDAVSCVFSNIHVSVGKYSLRMLLEMKRYNYVTPTNYLQLVCGYKEMLTNKRDEIASQANKLRNGLWKIDDCRDKVEVMSVELQEAQIKVAEFQQQCDEYMIIILAQKKQADEQQKEVAQKSIKIREDEIQCQKLADMAQGDLDEAMPALEAAIAALDSLSKKDISEMKSYGKPPQKVEMVMEAVMLLKGVDTSWAEAKRQLGELNFLKDLKEFDKNHITERTLKRIAAYTSNPEFEPDKVGVVSFAAKSLCLWVIAIEKYAKVWRYVAPKQARLDEALNSLKEKQLMLQEAQAKLAELNAMLKHLQEEYEDKLAQKEELDRKAELLRLKLERANILVDCLAGERTRWSETVTSLDIDFENLPGDCLLATAFLSYLGPFVTNYREELLDGWKIQLGPLEIPYTKSFDLAKFLCDPTVVREWNIQGLPADGFSTENGIIVTKGTRWPLLIDPQCQGVKWIKAMEDDNDIEVLDFGVPYYMKIIEEAVQFGRPVLLQNIPEKLDPSLNPVLCKAVVKQGGMDLIKLNDKLISYNADFRFFLTTKLPNPHYPPEISANVNIVNFAVKEQGLLGQLLGIVVRKERPQLEEQKDHLVMTIAKGKRTLIELENELLRLLNESSRDSLLENAELFDTLQNSKSTSMSVQESLETSETTEKQIDQAREGYNPCAKRAAILFFVISDMGKLDPMYQFALDSYILLFIKSIEKSPKAPILVDRITALNEYHTYAVYRNTCRTLFEHHKLLFSFHMCIKILEAMKKVSLIEYNFLLRGGVVLDKENQIDNPLPQWLSEEAWDNITELDKLGGFHGVIDTFEQNAKEWHTWYTHTEPETLPLIGEWNEICNLFQKMLFIRTLRQDRLSFSVSNFVINILGAKFVEPPVLDIRTVLEESSPETPLIFVLSPGVDPTASLRQLAEISEMSSKFHSLSLGQGQSPIATKLIQVGAKEGHWVFLANCHLSMSWMPKLDKIVESLHMGRVHPRFRLWLSSNPHPDFPISILQSGIKMTTEPPKGIKANLRRLYNLITEEQFEVCISQEKYKKLLFGLCFFHAVLLERKKFQQLGWNVIYSFNDSDFQVSENLLTIYLDNEQTPWDALKYLIAGINYGGHVTDDWDRRLLNSYINQYFCEDALNVPYFRLSSLGTYYIPRDGSLQTYMDYIRVLPNVDKPEAFGQHPNADITSQISTTRTMCENLMSLQLQQTSTADSTSKEDKVAKLAAEVMYKIPDPIDYERAEKLIGAEKAPLDVVLLQELGRYNHLLVNVKRSLSDLQKGILGLVVMSSELEEVFICIYEGRVPSPWLKAYSSLKSLGSWTRDLVARIEHFANWAETTHPPLLFWLSAYTFPTGFLTAVLQTAARLTEVPIDTLSWDFTVVTVDDNMIVEPPESGVYVRGMFLEGASWNKAKAHLIEPQPMQLVCTMPLIHFKPEEQLKKRTKGFYACPCYYYPIRTGSFVVPVDLRSGPENADFWIKRGTALILSLDT